MRKGGRLLLRCGAGAVGLLAAICLVPRFGAVYVAGSSMRPVCHAGDLAIYQRGPSGVGDRDIILYSRGDGSRVLHRVACVMLDGSLRTKGDANRSPDPGRVAGSSVVGVVVAIVPCGKAVDSMVSWVRWCYNHVPIANTQAMTEKTPARVRRQPETGPTAERARRRAKAVRSISRDPKRGTARDPRA